MMERDAFSADAHHYLDGEPFGELEGGEFAAADRLLTEAREYAALLEIVDPALDEAVMAAVRVRAPRRRALAWLLAPRTVRVRPVWAAVLAAAAALVVWLAPRAPAPAPAVEPAPAPLARPVADTVFVHFELAAPEARSVSVAGSFNGWQVGALAMTKNATGLWSATVALPVGEHRYDFVVDGKRWVPDPTAHAEVDDGFGGMNSVIVVGPKGLVRS